MRLDREPAYSGMAGQFVFHGPGTGARLCFEKADSSLRSE
jgi:hypothetical protein